MIVFGKECSEHYCEEWDLNLTGDENQVRSFISEMVFSQFVLGRDVFCVCFVALKTWSK